MATAPGYALAHLRTPQMVPEVLEYLDRIQGTLDPYGGVFLVHGAEVEVLEGSWPGTVVIVRFPSVQHARDWYASPAYQDILPLRTDHIECETIVVAGVGEGYDPAHLARAVRAADGAA